jgi:hypothetical protein
MKKKCLILQICVALLFCITACIGSEKVTMDKSTNREVI